ncbi:MAG: hypothetical protein VB144_13100 [Clostridia bacterium]|nr:hypothetical protein [Clostridia bacterium]
MAQDMAEKDDVGTIILGCGVMLGVDELIEKEAGVPVVVPGKAGVVMAEGIARLGLAQSKRAFASPPPKEHIS